MRDVVYPWQRNKASVGILTVSAGETVEYSLDLPERATEITDPLYTVIGSAGETVSPSEWKMGGGSVTAKLKKRGRQVRVKIVAPATGGTYALARLAAANPQTRENSLEIFGR